MRDIPDGSIDVIVTDVPYGIGENSKRVASRGQLARPIDYGDFEWDKERLPREHFDEMRRVSKHQVVFGGNYYTDYLPPTPSWIVWDKLNSGDFADCEMAWTSHKRAARMFRYMWNGMIKQKPEKRFHPTQKPLDLMIWVVDKYTDEGNTVADFFMGSGTAGVACVKLNRNFIGIEISEQYFNIAKKRIEEAQMQQSLFV
jgi:DNA modification methylase